MIICKFCQTFTEELMSIFCKFFKKNEEEETLLNSFYEASITLIPKPDKDPPRKEYYPKNLLKIQMKIPHIILANQMEYHRKGDLYTTKRYLSQKCRVLQY